MTPSSEVASRSTWRPLPQRVFEKHYPVLELSDMTKKELNEKIAKQRAQIIVLKKRIAEIRNNYTKVAREANIEFKKARAKYAKFNKRPGDKTPREIIDMRTYLQVVDNKQKSRLSKIYTELSELTNQIERIEYEINKMRKELLRRIK